MAAPQSTAQEFIDAAVEIIDELGQTLVLRRPAETTVVDKPWRVAAASTYSEHTCEGALVPYPPDVGENQQGRQIGDQQLFVPVSLLDVTPIEKQDMFEVGDDLWGVVTLTTYQLGGFPILHHMQVRKWPQRSS